MATTETGTMMLRKLPTDKTWTRTGACEVNILGNGSSTLPGLDAGETAGDGFNNDAVETAKNGALTVEVLNRIGGCNGVVFPVETPASAVGHATDGGHRHFRIAGFAQPPVGECRPEGWCMQVVPRREHASGGMTVLVEQTNRHGWRADDVVGAEPPAHR